jgi:hypothetical protein
LKFFLLALIFLFALAGAATGQTQPFGKIDTADLKMTSCSFEKDANAMVLFDHQVVVYKGDEILMERHKRIKIFNDHGKDEANIRIEYLGVHKDENVTDVEAETVNLNNKTIEYTAIDPKLIYTQIVDKETKAIIFTFPNVKSGSIIEFKYKWETPYPYNYPDWAFQSLIPTRYSEFDAGFNYNYEFEYIKKVYQPFTIDTAMKVGKKNDIKSARCIWALSNVNSYKIEPYMDYPDEYLQRISLNIHHKYRTWIDVADNMLADEDFGEQLNKNLGKQDAIVNKAKSLKTDDQKIAYIFDTVKNAMKWNKADRWYCIDGVKKAWDKKIGNATEINLILYHLLASANVDAYLLALRTRDYGKLDLQNPTLSQLNRVVVYCKVDSAKRYVLDASDKLNLYNNVPADLMGLYALSMAAETKKYELVTLQTGSTREVTLINGSINAEGKLEGTNQISSTTYSREKYLKRYNDEGEKKYIDELQKDNNGLKITSLKIENMQNDTLPLYQTFEFKYSLTEPDGQYMYFNPNLFTGITNNPFLAETRVSNIDLGCLYSYSINCRYQLPPGYKVDVLPKSTSMQMPDKSIVFKRFEAEQDGSVMIHYTLDYKRSIYTKDEYPSIRDFYNKMYEMLNEQIVLKKQ